MLELGPHRIDLDAGRVASPDGEVVLGEAEATVLRELARAGGHPVSREDLERAVWPDGAPTRGVDDAVRRLRRKLELDPGAPRWLHTVHGVGYRLQVRAVVPEPLADDGSIETGGFRLPLAAGELDLARRVMRRDGEDLALSESEARLLRVLILAAGRPIERRTLYRRVWDVGHLGSSRAVDHAVRRLRTKIERDPGEPDHLLTVRGKGYRFAVPVAGTWVLVVRGPELHQVVALSARPVTVGRAPDNDVVLPSAEVSRRHAEARVVGDRVEIRDLDSANGLFRDDQRVDQTTLGDGDVVTMPPYALEVRLRGESEQTLPPTVRRR